MDIIIYPDTNLCFSYFFFFFLVSLDVFVLIIGHVRVTPVILCIYFPR